MKKVNSEQMPEYMVDWRRTLETLAKGKACGTCKAVNKIRVLEHHALDPEKLNKVPPLPCISARF